MPRSGDGERGSAFFVQQALPFIRGPPPPPPPPPLPPPPLPSRVPRGRPAIAAGYLRVLLARETCLAPLSGSRLLRSYAFASFAPSAISLSRGEDAGAGSRAQSTAIALDTSGSDFLGAACASGVVSVWDAREAVAARSSLRKALAPGTTVTALPVTRVPALHEFRVRGAVSALTWGSARGPLEANALVVLRSESRVSLYDIVELAGSPTRVLGDSSEAGSGFGPCSFEEGFTSIAASGGAMVLAGDARGRVSLFDAREPAAGGRVLFAEAAPSLAAHATARRVALPIQPPVSRSSAPVGTVLLPAVAAAAPRAATVTAAQPPPALSLASFFGRPRAAPPPPSSSFRALEALPHKVPFAESALFCMRDARPDDAPPLPTRTHWHSRVSGNISPSPPSVRLPLAAHPALRGGDGGSGGFVSRREWSADDAACTAVWFLDSERSSCGGVVGSSSSVFFAATAGGGVAAWDSRKLKRAAMSTRAKPECIVAWDGAVGGGRVQCAIPDSHGGIVFVRADGSVNVRAAADGMLRAAVQGPRARHSFDGNDADIEGVSVSVRAGGAALLDGGLVAIAHRRTVLHREGARPPQRTNIRIVHGRATPVVYAGASAPAAVEDIYGAVGVYDLSRAEAPSLALSPTRAASAPLVLCADATGDGGVFAGLASGDVREFLAGKSRDMVTA